jgi:FMN phosphatase YigB (HAD superfamily)
MSIEAVVFDIGNVLVPFDWQIFHRRLRADYPNLPTEAEKQFRELMQGHRSLAGGLP